MADNGPTGPIGPVSTPGLTIKLDTTLVAGVMGGVMLKGLMDGM